MSDIDKKRIVFAAVANTMFGSSLTDSNRKDYWKYVLEPVYWKLVKGWKSRDRSSTLTAAQQWEVAVSQALSRVPSPQLWRKPKPGYEQKKEDALKGQLVNTKAFWTRQKFGPAGPVTKIDPSTYKLED